MARHFTRRNLPASTRREWRGFHSVLLPVDLTPGSDRAIGRLALLPLATDARVTILHVVPGSLLPRERGDAERDAEQALAGVAHDLRKALPASASIHPLVRFGAAAKEIGNCAREVDADIVVMGRSSQPTLSDAFLGSTAERVVRQTSLPVLVVQLPPREVYRRPALALEFDEVAHELVTLVLRVLPPPRPRLAIIHAYDVPHWSLLYPSLTAGEADRTRDSFRIKAKRELDNAFAATLADTLASGEESPPWETYVDYGSARFVVRKVMKEMDTDLLVLGTRGYSRAADVFLGTAAGDLLRGAECDVLVAPPSPAGTEERRSELRNRLGE